MPAVLTEDSASVATRPTGDAVASGAGHSHSTLSSNPRAAAVNPALRAGRSMASPPLSGSVRARAAYPLCRRGYAAPRARPGGRPEGRARPVHGPYTDRVSRSTTCNLTHVRGGGASTFHVEHKPRRRRDVALLPATLGRAGCGLTKRRPTSARGKSTSPARGVPHRESGHPHGTPVLRRNRDATAGDASPAGRGPGGPRPPAASRHRGAGSRSPWSGACVCLACRSAG